MAYNYYPNYFQASPFFPNNMQMPQNASNLASNASPASNSGIVWVQGENAAKAYPVASGQSILLMDSEDSVMYIKSTDQSGMPQPLRIFDYTERISPNKDAKSANLPKESEEFVSRKEFEEFREDVKRSIKGIRKPHIEEGEG